MRILTALEMELLKDIGQDGLNSDVFHVFDPQLQAELAVKRIPLTEFQNAQEFFAEAKKLYDSRHNHVVDVKFGSIDANYVYIAMPLYRKGSLKDLLRTKFLTVREIIKISIGFLSGLHHIHCKELIHFDLKPTNILFDNSGKAMVTDFGLANYVNQHGVAQQPKLYGRHIAPECLATTGRTITSDIYQAGLTIYRMANGDDLFEQQCAKYDFTTPEGVKQVVEEINKKKFPERRYPPHIPLSLKKIINKAISPRPNDRYQSVLDLLNDLAKVSDNLDWQFSSSNNQLIWLKDDGERLHTVELTKDNEKFTLAVKKLMLESNKTTNNKKLSKTGIENESKALGEVAKTLKALD